MAILELDDNNSGAITKQEFEDRMKHHATAHFFSSLGLNVSNASEVFDLLEGVTRTPVGLRPGWDPMWAGSLMVRVLDVVTGSMGDQGFPEGEGEKTMFLCAFFCFLFC